MSPMRREMPPTAATRSSPSIAMTELQVQQRIKEQQERLVNLVISLREQANLEVKHLRAQEACTPCLV